MRYIKLICVLSSFLLLLFCKQENQELTLGFVPSRSVHEIQVSAGKIADYLSKELDMPVKSVTLTNYAAVVIGMKTERVDFAFVGPLNYLILHKKTGAYPITSAVRKGENGYRSLIIANQDSKITSVMDLKGKTMAFGDALSASANLYPKAILRGKGIDPKTDIKSMTVSSQSAIVLSVMQGTVDAGAIYEDARMNPEVISKFPDVMSKTSIVSRSELIPADPQVVRKGLDPKLVKKLQQALISLSDSYEGGKWLKDIYGIDALILSNDKNFERLRKVVNEVNPALLGN